MIAAAGETDWFGSLKVQNSLIHKATCSRRKNPGPVPPVWRLQTCSKHEDFLTFNTGTELVVKKHFHATSYLHSDKQWALNGQTLASHNLTRTHFFWVPTELKSQQHFSNGISNLPNNQQEDDTTKSSRCWSKHKQNQWKFLTSCWDGLLKLLCLLSGPNS